MLIKNYKQLATTQQRRRLISLTEAGMQAVLPSIIMPKVLRFDKRNKTLKVKNKKFKIQGRIFVMGGGKASGLMAETLECIIPAEYIRAGIINCTTTNYKTKKIKIIKASHPIPNIHGVKGVKKMLAIKEKYKINKNDLIICLISGGGSALLPYAAQGIKLKDKQVVTKLLLESGAKIQEINVIRRHLSKIKGGQMAKFFAPTRIVSLIISDVVGNDLDTIASGLTAPDKSTWQDAYRVLKKYNLWKKVPARVASLVKNGLAGKNPETPKKLTNCDNYIVADNRTAIKAMASKARELGLKPFVMTDKLTGETSKMAKKIAQDIKAGKYGANLLILGGETTSVLPANYGRGGRNQYFAAVSLLALKNYPGQWAMVSLATDGSDFIPGIGGAMIDNQTLDLIKKKRINLELYIKKFDSYNLFKKAGGCLIKMNNTGTNVGDVIIYILENK